MSSSGRRCRRRRVVALELVEQRGGGLLDPLPQRRDGSRGEHRRHQLAVLRVVGRFHRKQRRRSQRVKQSRVGLLGDPAQRSGQIAAQFGDPEIVGAQQLVRDAVVEGHQHGTAPDHRASVAVFVGERAWVLPHLGVGDQPRLRVAAAETELREASDDAVHREPADSLPHSAELTTAGTVVQASNSGAPAERVHPPAGRRPLAASRQLRPSTMTFARTVSASSSGRGRRTRAIR